MDFFRRATGPPPVRLGVFPGTFNPVTIAHLALARAAAAYVDEVVFVLPRAFPHKEYAGAPFEGRIGMLCSAVAAEPVYSVASTAGGLFAEIAAECAEAYGAGVRLSFLCGRDAAERAANWDYGRPGAFAGMLRDFELLVAGRGGGYEPAPELRARVRTLELTAGLDGVSASEVRRRIARGEPWEHMTPAAIRAAAKAIYG